MYKNIDSKIEKYQGWEKGVGAIPYVLDRLIIDCSREERVTVIEEFYSSHTYLWLLEFGTFSPLIKDILEIYNFEKDGKFIEKFISFYYDYFDFEEIKNKKFKKFKGDFNKLLSNVILKMVEDKENNYIDIKEFMGSHTYLWLLSLKDDLPNVDIVLDILLKEKEDGLIGFIEGYLQYYVVDIRE